ncbi:MAG: hypothetical protein WC551_13600 [Patescibacteria group bacterium]
MGKWFDSLPTPDELWAKIKRGRVWYILPWIVVVAVVLALGVALFAGNKVQVILRRNVVKVSEPPKNHARSYAEAKARVEAERAARAVDPNPRDPRKLSDHLDD